MSLRNWFKPTPKLAPPTSMAVVQPSVRSLAKADGVDLNMLLEILKRQRPDKSFMEQSFCDEFILSVNGMQEDAFGNFWCQIGDDVTTMFSCHTDTVAKDGGYQNVEWREDLLGLHNGKPGQCLGADDGAGIWLMLEMIKANKPGLYIFHRSEEVGGLGSGWIVKNAPQLVHGIKRAIAFDRKGTDSVITHQRGSRCCSDVFAKALAAELNKFHGFTYKPDSTGVFTDTANYDELIPECTNLSTGYYKEHGPLETLDVMHLYQLRDALLQIDFEALPTERDPSVIEFDDYSYYGGYSYKGYSGYSGWSKSTEPDNEYTEIEKVIEKRSYTLARIFAKRGLTAKDVDLMCNEYWMTFSKSASSKSNVDRTYTSVLECDECGADSEPWSLGDEWQDGDQCPECGSRQTYARDYLIDDDRDLAEAGML